MRIEEAVHRAVVGSIGYLKEDVYKRQREGNAIDWATDELSDGFVTIWIFARLRPNCIIESKKNGFVTIWIFARLRPTVSIA